METFKIRSYGKSELALLYSPYITAAAARKKLNVWIGMQPSLVEDLRRYGFSESSHSFTPAQVRLIVDAIGEP